MDGLIGGGPTEKHVYLAGAIEYAPDDGRGWRKEIGAFLRNDLGLAVFDPCEREMAVMNAEEKAGFRRWKSEDRPRFLPVIRRISNHAPTPATSNPPRNCSKPCVEPGTAFPYAPHNTAATMMTEPVWATVVAMARISA